MDNNTNNKEYLDILNILDFFELKKGLFKKQKDNKLFYFILMDIMKEEYPLTVKSYIDVLPFVDYNVIKKKKFILISIPTIVGFGKGYSKKMIHTSDNNLSFKKEITNEFKTEYRKAVIQSILKDS